jgi:hypothetical protein
MVGVLHQQGFQRLRIAPGLGLSWRCPLTPIANIQELNGARIADYDAGLSAFYCSADENLYFGWQDRQTANSRQLAETFVERFPRIAEASHGRDWQYAGWFQEVLGHTEASWLPVAVGGSARDDATTFVSPVHDGEGPIMPLPPPGWASAQPEEGIGEADSNQIQLI